MLNIVLHEPEIPANTGNIGRTCVATNTRLHLIEPLGFRLNEKNLKRAGMDYWEHLDVRTYIDYNDFLEKNPGAKIYMATTKAPKVYTEVNYEPDCYIMFGKESAGIPEEILVDHRIGKRVVLPRSILHSDRLRLRHNENSFRFYFSLLNFASSNNKYAYHTYL